MAIRFPEEEDRGTKESATLGVVQKKSATQENSFGDCSQGVATGILGYIIERWEIETAKRFASSHLLG